MGFVTLKCGHFIFTYYYFILSSLVTLDFKAQLSQLTNY